MCVLVPQELRVWDLRDQDCLQVMQHFGKLGTQVPYAYCLNRHNSLLLLATSQLGVLEPSSGGEFFASREISSHSKPLCAALYNTNFNQVGWVGWGEGEGLRDERRR